MDYSRPGFLYEAVSLGMICAWEWRDSSLRTQMFRFLVYLILLECIWLIF